MNTIAVCTPARDQVHTRFAFDLVTAICGHATKSQDTVIPLASEGTLIQSQRCELVKAALDANATHILFLDSDMRFPADIIGRMLAADAPVVAANCAKRRIPTGPTAENHGEGREVYTMPDSTGIEKVDFVGGAVLMIRAEVFGQIPQPWFATPWVKQADTFMGEDRFFCRQLAQAGIPIVIDHDLSKEIGHIGLFEFRHEHTWVNREAANGAGIVL